MCTSRLITHLRRKWDVGWHRPSFVCIEYPYPCSFYSFFLLSLFSLSFCHAGLGQVRGDVVQAGCGRQAWWETTWNKRQSVKVLSLAPNIHLHPSRPQLPLQHTKKISPVGTLQWRPLNDESPRSRLWKVLISSREVPVGPRWWALMQGENGGKGWNAPVFIWQSLKGQRVSKEW